MLFNHNPFSTLDPQEGYSSSPHTEPWHVQWGSHFQAEFRGRRRELPPHLGALGAEAHSRLGTGAPSSTLTLTGQWEEATRTLPEPPSCRLAKPPPPSGRHPHGHAASMPGEA